MSSAASTSAEVQDVESPGPADSVLVPVPSRSRLFLLLKRALQRIFLVFALPRLVSYFLSKRLLGQRAFGASSESIARIPGLRGVLLRQAFYRQTLVHCGQDVHFGWLSVFSMTEARLGDRVYIGRYCSLGFADIGDETMLADGVQVLSGGHEHDHGDGNGNGDGSMQSKGQSYKQVRIGKGSWIGAGAVIMADVGEGAIVGAGAVVSKAIPPHSVAVGVPARVVRSLHDNADCRKIAQPNY